jgi:GNAT superfamily N-acetyltransferase
MENMVFRPFAGTDEDYEFVARLWNENFPNQPESARQIRYSDQAWDKKFLRERFLCELAGEPVASCIIMEPSWSHQAGKYYADFTLLKAHQGRGLEEQIFAFLMQQLGRFELKMLITSAREDETEKRSLLDSKGFALTMRYPVSYLAVNLFDPSPYIGLCEKLAREGVRAVTAASLIESEPGFYRRWYDFQWEILQDVPHPGPLTRTSFEQFLKWRQGPTFLPDGVFFALDEGEMVGTSGLWRNDASEKYLITGLTGVRRSHRRRGIATMLKVETIKFAKDYGAEQIETDNEENNPMYQLNLRLGYVPAPAWMDFEKFFDPPPAALI